MSEGDCKSATKAWRTRNGKSAALFSLSLGRRRRLPCRCCTHTAVTLCVSRWLHIQTPCLLVYTVCTSCVAVANSASLANRKRDSWATFRLSFIRRSEERGKQAGGQERERGGLEKRERRTIFFIVLVILFVITSLVPRLDCCTRGESSAEQSRC